MAKQRANPAPTGAQALDVPLASPLDAGLAATVGDRTVAAIMATRTAATRVRFAISTPNDWVYKPEKTRDFG
jgi:hypothetical protein